ncbi:MAG: site-specific DNA-methyltransferase [Spiribacter salinus]|uniref:Methyltransferase n=1 Tax=Spiribacter salinus TaxID=1335746 RepID=A0A540V976_9GAMM|nr:MAG: site-specific DNA-methyltransferase [Spiribacter salinus]
MIDLRCGDCIDELKKLDDDSIDAIVTDPPYGLTFMGKAWDKSVPSVEVWSECLRVLKPGGHLLSFAGTRTQHRMAVNIEDAGFEIRDMIAWVYGSGFPKSLDVSKAIDKAAGAEREISGPRIYADGTAGSWRKTTSGKYAQDGWTKDDGDRPKLDTAPATDAAQQWDGWGTALKPALEPITLARKPFKSTVAANVLEHGTGAINVDGCRVDAADKAKFPAGVVSETEKTFGGGEGLYANRPRPQDKNPQGRWPANLIHDGSDEVVGLFPVSKSAGHYKDPKGDCIKRQGSGSNVFSGFDAGNKDARKRTAKYSGEDGSAARFFYCAKASKKDRGDDNKHPTVKPTDLMRYLVRLVTPPGGTVLDPFMGSGSTGKAAMLEGFDFIGIELDPEYIEIARARIDAHKDLFAA